MEFYAQEQATPVEQGRGLPNGSQLLKNFYNKEMYCVRCESPILLREAWGWDDSSTYYCEKCASKLNMEK